MKGLVITLVCFGGAALASVRAFTPALWLYAWGTKTWPERRSSFLSGIGLVYERMGDRNQAISAYEEATQADPTDAMRYFDLACAYEADGKRELALRNYEKALDLGAFGADFTARLQSKIASLSTGR